MFHSALHFNQERRLSAICANWLGHGENDAWTARDLARVVSVKGGRADAGGMAMSGVETIAQHAAEIVRARGRAVQSLHQRGVTWVSFVPMPDLVGGINFTIRKLPGLGLLSGTVEGIRHEHTRGH